MYILLIGELIIAVSGSFFYTNTIKIQKCELENSERNLKKSFSFSLRSNRCDRSFNSLFITQEFHGNYRFKILI